MYPCQELYMWDVRCCCKQFTFTLKSIFASQSILFASLQQSMSVFQCLSCIYNNTAIITPNVVLHSILFFHEFILCVVGRFGLSQAISPTPYCLSVLSYLSDLLSHTQQPEISHPHNDESLTCIFLQFPQKLYLARKEIETEYS